jgi:hypothetical protein
VIFVNSLAFKRFLDIAIAIKQDGDVVADNDGNTSKVKARYAGCDTSAFVKLQYDEDEVYLALEPQFLRKNGRAKIGETLGKSFQDDASAISYMIDRKAETALKGHRKRGEVLNFPESQDACRSVARSANL